MRKKDIVLMATVTSFEGLPMPGKTELKQFADLFLPLYMQSGEDARRLAVAALSQCPTLPMSVCQFIASQPIAIAATFLTASPALDDETLIAIARTQGPDHARAIAARADLSVKVVDALVSLHGDHGMPVSAAKAEAPVTRDEAPAATPTETDDVSRARETRRRASEDLLRQDLKARVMRQPAPRGQDAADMRATQEALLVRFARQRHAHEFATCLADMIGSTMWLVERIMLDLSGVQLATTLKASATPADDALYVLSRFYPHLARSVDGTSRAASLWAELAETDCRERLASWLRADRMEDGETPSMPDTPANANRILPEEAIPLPRRATIRPQGRVRVKAGSRSV